MCAIGKGEEKKAKQSQCHKEKNLSVRAEGSRGIAAERKKGRPRLSKTGTNSACDLIDIHASCDSFEFLGLKKTCRPASWLQQSVGRARRETISDGTRQPYDNHITSGDQKSPTDCNRIVERATNSCKLDLVAGDG